MKTLLFLYMIAGLMTATDTHAQIEMTSDGRVGVGDAPNSGQRLNVFASGLSTGIFVSQLDGTSATRTGILSLSRYGMYSRGIFTQGAGASTNNYGIYAIGQGGLTAYGVYASASLASNNNYAGYFSGDLAYTGSLIIASDLRFKEDVRSIADAGILARLLQLKPKTYVFSADADFMHPPSGRRYGLIAQEVEVIFPELVVTQSHPGPVDEDGIETGESISFKGIAYVELIPILVQAIKDQQLQIDAMRAALEANGIQVVPLSGN